MLKIFWSVSGSLSPESLLFSSHHLFLLKLFYRLEINGHKKRGSRQDLIWMESKKYNTANIIQRRYKSHSISRNDVFPSSQKRKSKFYSRHMSSRRRSVLSAWTNFPLWKVCAKTVISRTEFKSGTAVRVINHSDHSSCVRKFCWRKYLRTLWQKSFLEHELVLSIWVKIISRDPQFCAAGIWFLWTLLATTGDKEEDLNWWEIINFGGKLWWN